MRGGVSSQFSLADRMAFSPRCRIKTSAPFRVHRPSSMKQTKAGQQDLGSSRLISLGKVFSPGHKAYSSKTEADPFHQFLFSSVRQLKLRTVLKNYRICIPRLKNTFSQRANWSLTAQHAALEVERWKRQSPDGMWKTPISWETLDLIRSINVISQVTFSAIGKRLTNRLELLFRTVLAFPKASSSGLDCKIMSLTCCHSKQTRC